MPSDVSGLRDTRCFFDLDLYLFGSVTDRFVQHGTLNAFDFYAIITWKSNRSKTRVRNGLQATGVRPHELISEVAALSDDREKMARLTAVDGIGVPIASAILTVCYPDRFTVLDYRAWETLLEFGRVRGSTPPSTVAGYFEQYLPVCKTLATDTGLGLRELDRALWGWSMRRGIEALT